MQSWSKKEYRTSCNAMSRGWSVWGSTQPQNFSKLIKGSDITSFGTLIIWEETALWLLNSDWNGIFKIGTECRLLSFPLWLFVSCSIKEDPHRTQQLLLWWKHCTHIHTLLLYTFLMHYGIGPGKKGEKEDLNKDRVGAWGMALGWQWSEGDGLGWDGNWDWEAPSEGDSIDSKYIHESGTLIFSLFYMLSMLVQIPMGSISHRFGVFMNLSHATNTIFPLSSWMTQKRNKRIIN